MPYPWLAVFIGNRSVGLLDYAPVVCDGKVLNVLDKVVCLASSAARELANWMDVTMKRLISLWLTATIIGSTCAYGSGAPICIDDANDVDRTKAFQNLREGIKNNKYRTAEVQLLLQKQGVYDGKIDGVLSKTLSAALCNSLIMYSAIMIRRGRFEIRNPNDVSLFTKWLYDIVISKESGGDFPD